jgi:hypothetical protein
VRALVRQRLPELVLDVQEEPVREGVRPLAVAVEARGPDGTYEDLLRPVVRVEAGGGEVVDVTLRQTGPGRYEGAVSADATEILTLTVAGAETGISSRLIVPDNAAEYRFDAPDETLLRSLARTTGGTLGADPQALSSTAGASRVARRALWPMLVMLALGLWLADIALRRVRVFERV